MEAAFFVKKITENDKKLVQVFSQINLLNGLDEKVAIPVRVPWTTERNFGSSDEYFRRFLESVVVAMHSC